MEQETISGIPPILDCADWRRSQGRVIHCRPSQPKDVRPRKVQQIRFCKEYRHCLLRQQETATLNEYTKCIVHVWYIKILHQGLRKIVHGFVILINVIDKSIPTPLPFNQCVVFLVRRHGAVPAIDNKRQRNNNSGKECKNDTTTTWSNSRQVVWESAGRLSCLPDPWKPCRNPGWGRMTPS